VLPHAQGQSDGRALLEGEVKTRYWVVLAALLFLFGCWLGHRAGVNAAYVEMRDKGAAK
jgi:hypothetical protein